MAGHPPQTGKVLVGFSRCSGSNLLWHMIASHSWCVAVDEPEAGKVLFSRDPGNPLTPSIIRCHDAVYRYPASTYIGLVEKRIWITRDPRDCWASARERWPGTDLDPGFWAQAHRQFLDTRNCWLLVRYESLVAKPQRELERIFHYLDLEYQDTSQWRRQPTGGSCPKLWKTSGIHHGSSVGRWRRDLTALDLDALIATAGQEMQEMGYL